MNMHCLHSSERKEDRPKCKYFNAQKTSNSAPFNAKFDAFL